MLDLTTRETLVATLPKGGKVVEVGVQTGDFSQHLLESLEPESLLLVDCWEHQLVSVYGHDPANEATDVQLRRYVHVMNRFRGDPRVSVWRMYSRHAAALLIEDRSVSVVYLDGNHLQVREDIEAWRPKLKSGGWLLGHDYTVCGDYINVKPVVDQYVAEQGLDLLVTGEPNYPTWAFREP